MYRRVLVPLDGSALAERALAHAERIAAQGGEIVLFQVLEPEAVMPPLGVSEVASVREAERVAREMREASIRREVEPIVDFVPSLIACAVTTGLAVVFARTLPLAPQHVGSLLVPAALATVLAGFLVMSTRRKAITQVAGYLILENGVFIMGVGMLDAIPFLVEAGVLLDLFVAVFVMGIIIYQINREFASLDTARLSNLKE